MPNDHVPPDGETNSGAHEKEQEMGRFFGLDPMTALRQLASADPAYRRQVKHDPKAALTALGIDTAGKEVRVFDPDDEDVVLIMLSPADSNAAARSQVRAE